MMHWLLSDISSMQINNITQNNKIVILMNKLKIENNNNLFYLYEDEQSTACGPSNGRSPLARSVTE